jgi:hypothetical protein
MTERNTAQDLVRSLSRRGFSFREFTLSSEGAWSPEDADWNYKDIPHLNVVHTQADAEPAAVEDELIATLNLQRIAKIPMPLALVNYVAKDGSQVYYTSLLCYVLIIETRIVDLSSSADGSAPRTRVDTTYHIGGPRWAMVIHPLIRRVMTSNYRVLMSEDLPMREQRGRLRIAGFRFVSDNRPRTFAETSDLTVTNVIAPPTTNHEPFDVNLETLVSEGSCVLAGPGPGGLRFVLGRESEILVFDRVCGHEGACLDDAIQTNERLVCPWHAKRVKPLARFDLLNQQPQRLTAGPHYSLLVDGSRRTVTVVAGA